MASVYGLFDHGGSIVRVADHAFSLRIQEKFFPAKQIFSSLPAVRAEVTGRTQIGPSDILAFPEFIEGLPEGQRYFTPADLKSPGLLLAAQIILPRINRSPSVRQTVEFVLPI
mgnify:FL=1